jgi:hypothetical protein
VNGLTRIFQKPLGKLALAVTSGTLVMLIEPERDGVLSFLRFRLPVWIALAMMAPPVIVLWRKWQKAKDRSEQLATALSEERSRPKKRRRGGNFATSWKKW